MAAPDLTKLTADELRNLAIDFERNWTDRARALCELHRRAQANDALRSHAETVRKERESRNRGGADDCFTDNARSRQRESEAIESILSLLAAAPAAPPTPAAPVTDDDAPGGDDGVEPGAPIAHLTCPGCKGALEIVHGDEVGAVSAMWVLDGDTRLTVGRYTAAPLFKVTLEKDEQPKGAEVTK